MKKCIRCDIVFYLEERLRCLYCDSILMSVPTQDQAVLIDDKPFDVFRGVGDFLKSAGRGDLDRKQYILGGYFRSRTFSSMYALCRNDFKMGKEYPRFLIRPMSFIDVLSLPWCLINLVDSVLFRFFYIGFCEKCQCKYRPRLVVVGHEKNECEYYREYTAVVRDIMTGRIAMTEAQHKQQAREKIAKGQRSAYQDLCSQKNGVHAFLDITSIWVTVCLAIYLIARLAAPVILKLPGIAGE